MGKKIFRLHNDGITEETGWFNSKPLNSEQLNSIRTNGKEVATSIPTPFAQIDLVKSSFDWVAKNDLKGTTAQHKLVSYALDVGQLFFAYPRFKDKLRIIAYNPKDRFSELKTKNEGQKKFAQTLELFWQQDNAFNFDKTKRLYVLLNKHTNEVIGSTSPSTIFMSSPDVRYASKNLDVQIASHKLFNDKFTPLQERDKSFIVYLYALSKQSNFADYFEEFYLYLDKVKSELPDDLINIVTEQTSTGMNQYDPCPVLDNPGDPCEVLGIKLGIQGEEKVVSDFEIKPDYNIKEELPLVLPQYPFTKEWNYVSGIIWDENTRTPEKNEKGPDESKLPVQNIPYYWLSVGNFLEDKIIELPYNIDSDKFITCGSEKHLLPLKPTYFRYFNAESVKKHLTIIERAGGNVDVELTIPVKGGDITFKKQYSLANKNIEALDLHLAIFPFLKSNEFDISHYIGLLDDRSDKSDKISLYEITNGKKNFLDNPTSRNPGEGNTITSFYYKTKKQPDVFGLSLKYKTEGCIVPKMRKVMGDKTVDFAVDFGTTNTHIEYKTEDNVSLPFKNVSTNSLWQSLMNRKSDFKKKSYLLKNEYLFDVEILPYDLTENNSLHFPSRTAIIFNKDVNFKNKVEIISEVNNFLLYEKRKEPNYLNISTNLKWSNYSKLEDDNKLESYLEYLVTMIYYKSLMLGGNPNTTSITWFYPVSMDDYEFKTLNRIWEKVYNKIFNVESGLFKMPESVAPYLFYKSSIEGLSLSIDIGGGSSDIAVFDENDIKAKFISSFKFAGDSIFGDGYPSNEFKNNSDRNGFVNTFKSQAEEIIKSSNTNTSNELNEILRNITEAKKSSSDFSSFLFSLERNKEVNLNYTQLLQKDDRLKLSFLVFYASLAFYSAKLLYKSNVNIPKNVLLSGTASKSIQILDPVSNLKNSNTFKSLTNISNLYKFIFEKVYTEGHKHKLKVQLSNIPKQITCKGALKLGQPEDIVDVPVKFWLGGKNQIAGNVIDKIIDFRTTPKYKEIPKFSNEISESIKEFYSILDDYNETYSLKDLYNISPDAYLKFNEIRNDNLDDLITKGVKAYHKKDDSTIEETLFFYPLVGILNKLSYELSLNNKEDD